MEEPNGDGVGVETQALKITATFQRFNLTLAIVLGLWQ